MQEYKIATTLMETLFNRRFHQHGKGKNKPKPSSPKYAFFYKRLYEKILKQEPIEIILGFGYHKNLNASRYPEPDEAERKSLEFLVIMAKEVEKIYNKGMIVTIFTTGERAAIANEANLNDTLAYYYGLKEMIDGSKEFSKYFRILRLGKIWDAAGENFYGLLDTKAAKIRQKIDAEPTKYEQLCIQAARNQRHEYTAEDDAIKDSVARFLASFEVERELNLFENFFPGSIMASYRPIPYYKHPTLIPWTIHKGDITQPWQGPYDPVKGQVMTQNRQILWQNKVTIVSGTA